MKIVAFLALSLSLCLSLGACVETDGTDTTASELGLQPGGANGNRFHWNAYEKKPYIYMGCPDPGPEPWAELATLFVPRGMGVIELELGTAVTLDLRLGEIPPDPGFWFRPNSRGATIGIPQGAEQLRFSFTAISGRCSYELDAEIVVGQ